MYSSIEYRFVFPTTGKPVFVGSYAGLIVVFVIIGIAMLAA